MTDLVSVGDKVYTRINVYQKQDRSYVEEHNNSETRMYNMAAKAKEEYEALPWYKQLFKVSPPPAYYFGNNILSYPKPIFVEERLVEVIPGEAIPMNIYLEVE